MTSSRMLLYSGGMGTPSQSMRIGHGYDLHRLEATPPDGEGRPFILAGLPIEHEKGPVGHSDGDAVLHAVTDALLGALGAEDIGQQFPDTDPEWRDADSRQFLEHAVDMMQGAGMRLGNLDVTVICERPKISPYKETMIRNMAGILGVDPGLINIKGKTHEKVDAVGQGHAIEVHAVVLLHATD